MYIFISSKLSHETSVLLNERPFAVDVAGVSAVSLQTSKFKPDLTCGGAVKNILILLSLTKITELSCALSKLKTQNQRQRAKKSYFSQLSLNVTVHSIHNIS